MRLKQRYYLVLLGIFTLLLSSCGTLTGIPSHGGGKRFAIEQEMVASTSKAVAKSINVDSIKGKKARLFFAAMGDQGAGNLSGGRLTLSGMLNAVASLTPETITYNSFPTVSASSTTTELQRDYNSGSNTSQSTSSTAGSTTTTGATTTTNSSTSTEDQTTIGSGSSHSGTHVTTFQGTSVLETPEKTVSKQDGEGYKKSIGIAYDGLGAYSNSMIITNPADTQYLSAVIQSHFVKNGVNLVSSGEAEVNIYITVDVFGTIRSRTDWLLYNNEKLTAKTAVEVDYFNSNDYSIIGKTQMISYEATYKEKYLLWTGPFETEKYMKSANGVLKETIL